MSDHTKVSAALFDFAGVISRTLFDTHRLRVVALGLEPGSPDWRGPFDPSSDTHWQHMPADRFTEREFWQTRASQVGTLRGEDWNQMSEFVQAASGHCPLAVVRPKFLDTLTSLCNAGISLAIQSNELDLFYGTGFRQRLPC